MFLSQGMQIAIFCVFVVLMLIFMKIVALEERIKNTENSLNNYVTVGDYMETFNVMWNEKEKGNSVSAFDEKIN